MCCILIKSSSRERGNSFFEKCGICAHQFPEDLAKPQLKYHYSKVEMREAAHCLMRWWWKQPCRVCERRQEFSAPGWFGMANEPTTVVACTGLSCGTTRKKKKKKCFGATALIKNGWLCFGLLSSLSFHVFCLSFFALLPPLLFLFFSSCWCWRQDGRSEETVMERKWSSGVTDEWQQRGRDNQRNGSISSSDKYLNFKGASADTGMWKRGTSPAQPHPLHHSCFSS